MGIFCATDVLTKPRKTTLRGLILSGKRRGGSSLKKTVKTTLKGSNIPTPMSKTSNNRFRLTGEGSTAGGVSTAETLTPRELASVFKTTVPTVLDWYHKGRIPAVVAVGRIYRFDLESVKAALAAKPETVASR